MSGPEKPTLNGRAEHSCITPEGYDVLTVEGAEGYLTEVHGLELPEAGGFIDSTTGYHLALRLQQEQRAALYYAEDLNDDQELLTQNVAEHSLKVGMTAVWKAMAERPELDAGKVAIMSLFHDVIEAYCKDTVVNDPVGLKSKYLRETAGMTLVKRDLGEDHPLIPILEEYEECQSAEAKFVKGRDKVEAYQFSLNNKAALHRKRQEHFPDVVEQALIRASIDRTAYKDMQAVMKELGRKWHVWGCMPFEGNPDEIVEQMARKVSEDQMRGPLPYAGSLATQETTKASSERYDLEVMHYDTGNLPASANVISLLERRRQRQGNYSSPTDPVA